MVRSVRVSAETICGAICVYLLLGLTWTAAYSILFTLQHGSFFVAPTHDANGVLTVLDLLYFSYVTLTALGYGDITPITSQARSLAFLEAVTGVLYLAVLISRLVGLYAARAAEDVR